MSKKRSLQDLNDDSDGDIVQSPSKRAKIDDDDAGSILNSFLLEHPEQMTIDAIKRLFAINTSRLTNRSGVFTHFRNLSLALVRDLVLVIPSGDKKKKL